MDNAVHVKVEVVNCGIVLLYLFRKRFRLLPLLKQSGSLSQVGGGVFFIVSQVNLI